MATYGHVLPFRTQYYFLLTDRNKGRDMLYDISCNHIIKFIMLGDVFNASE